MAALMAVLWCCLSNGVCGMSSDDAEQLVKRSHSYIENEDWVGLSSLFSENSKNALYESGFATGKLLGKHYSAYGLKAINEISEGVSQLDPSQYLAYLFMRQITFIEHNSQGRPNLSVVGSVKDGERVLVNVRTSYSIKEKRYEEVEVMPVIKTDDGLKLELSDRFKNVASLSKNRSKYKSVKCRKISAATLNILVQIGDLESFKRYFGCSKPTSTGAWLIFLPDGFSHGYASPLSVAAWHNRTEFVSFMLQNKVPVDVRDDQDMTPIFSAVEARSIEALNLLIKHGANLDHVTVCKENASECTSGATTLELAIATGNKEILSEVLKNIEKKEIVKESIDRFDAIVMFEGFSDENKKFMKNLLRERLISLSKK